MKKHLPCIMMRNAGDLTIVDYDQRINDLRLDYCL
jgi:hypothetical protein